MAAKRPAPSYPNGPDANTPFMRWLYQQVTEALGTSYSSLAEAIAAAAGSVDLSVIEADIADLQADVAVHETRIDALESDVGDLQDDVTDLFADVAAIEANEKYRTIPYCWRGGSMSVTSGGTFYLTPWFLAGGSSITAVVDAQIMMNNAGTIKNLRFMCIAPGADTDTFSLTLNKNGSDTTLTLPGLAGSDGTLHADTTHSVSVAIGDLIAIKQVNGGAQIACQDWTLSFDLVLDP